MYLLVTSAILALASAKVYERCELARELLNKHKAPKDQLATWVCIADHESRFNTSAIGTRNYDGSADHGIFQISDKYWCNPGWACGLDCQSLRDENLADDWKCVRRIYKEHQHLSGDGFNAWAVYGSHCKSSSVSDYLNGCFDKSTTDEKKILNNQAWYNQNRFPGFFGFQRFPSFDTYYPRVRPQPQPVVYVYRYF